MSCRKLPPSGLTPSRKPESFKMVKTQQDALFERARNAESSLFAKIQRFSVSETIRQNDYLFIFSSSSLIMLVQGEKMLKTYDMLKADLSDYKAPDMKIKRMTEKKEIIRLKRNLYETDPTVPGYLEAGAICNPSYLSFEYALSEHGLIPEGVRVYTCASAGLRKKKYYSNALGNYYYQDIPIAAFPYEVLLKTEGDRMYWLASAEKALCDKLYTLKPIRSKKEMIYMLFVDLRIDEDDFRNLDFAVLEELCPLYKSTSMKTLLKVIRDYQ